MSLPTPTPTDEAARLAKLRELVVLDSSPEPLFDTLAQLASEVCGAPIALLSLVDAERQWFKANVGLPGVNETPRDVAFCAHAIMDDTLLEVPDATRDPRFCDNPLVTGAPDIRFYAGAPLALPGGERVGTLCVLDRQERQLGPAQREMLCSLAKVASQALVMRRELIDRTLSVRSGYEQALAESEARHRALVEDQSELVSLARPDGELVYVNRAYAAHFGRTPGEMTGANLFDFVEPSHRESVHRLVDEVFRSGTGNTGENPSPSTTGQERWVAWTNSLQRDARGQPLLHSVGRDVTARNQAERALRELTTIFDNTPDYVVQSDASGTMVYMNPAARRATGVAADAPLAGFTFSEFNTPATNQRLASEMLPAVRAHGVWLGEAVVYAAGHREVPVSYMLIAHRGASGRLDRYSAVMRDISAEVEAKQALMRQTATLRSVAEAIPAIVAVAGTDGCYSFVNSAFERWCGAHRNHLIGRAIAQVQGRSDYERSRPWIERALAGETVSFEKDYPTRNGGTHLAITYIPLWLDSGAVDGFVSVALDVTQHKQEEVRLLQLSHCDPLTALLNRAGFEQYLERKLQDGGGPTLALLYVDLDHFKPVNDQHGHPVGDQVLQLFGARLRGLVRPTDAVARLGGDEFAVVLSGVREMANAQTVADKVIAATQAPFEVGELRLNVGASVGVAIGADPQTGWRDLVARADALLYRAKQAGRGRHASGN